MFGPNDFMGKLDVPRGTMDKLGTYVGLLTKWQKQINLVGPKTMDDVWFRHVYDSAQLAPLIISALGEDTKRTILDLGAGAGFPSLVLSLMGVGFAHPVESVGKKCSFMRTVIRETGAQAEVLQGRIEDLTPFPADIITARALATIDKLLNLSFAFVGKDTEFWLMKGRDWKNEVSEAEAHWQFEIDVYLSLTDNEGKILRLRNLKPKN
jgi:16S rRNA (guanine527-N7)-methyltransferase